MKRTPAIGFALLILGGCGRGDPNVPPQAASAESHAPTSSSPPASDEDAIKSAVAAYAATPLDQRYKCVVDGDALKGAMAEHYGHDVNDALGARIDGITFVNDSEAIADTTLSFNGEKGPATNRVSEYLRKQNGNWMIDWRANNGMNPMRLSVFLAARPSDRLTMRVNAEFSSYTPVTIPKESAYGFQLTDSYEDVRANGFALRASAVGKKLFGLFKDGGSRKITVVLERVGGDGVDSDFVLLDDLVSETWFIDGPAAP